VLQQLLPPQMCLLQEIDMKDWISAYGV